jgi:hypothetical protein
VLDYEGERFSLERLLAAPIHVQRVQSARANALLERLTLPTKPIPVKVFSSTVRPAPHACPFEVT